MRGRRKGAAPGLVVVAIALGCAARTPDVRSDAEPIAGRHAAHDSAVAAQSARRRETVPIPAPAVRGAPAQRAEMSEERRLAAYRTLGREFFRPTRGQARWIDPRPLADARTAAADAQVRADDGWAAAVVDAIAHPNVCALEGDDGACRGRAGGVLRLSVPYASGPDTALVFARYTPVRAGEDPAAATLEPERQGPELQFWLAWEGQGWRVVREATLEARR